MTKCILISMKSEDVVNILNRRTKEYGVRPMPSCELPFEACIYCTKQKPYLHKAHDIRINKDFYIVDKVADNAMNGAIVAKFIVNKMTAEHDFGKSILQIDSLTVFDEPLPLSDFASINARLKYAPQSWMYVIKTSNCSKEDIKK